MCEKSRADKGPGGWSGDEVIRTYDQLSIRLDELEAQLGLEIHESPDDLAQARGHIEILRRVGMLRVDIIELKRRRLVLNN